MAPYLVDPLEKVTWNSKDSWDEKGNSGGSQWRFEWQLQGIRLTLSTTKVFRKQCIMATEKPNPRNPSELEKGESGFVSSNGDENSQENSNTSSIDKVRESDGYVVQGTGGSEKGEDKIVSDIDIPLIMEGKDAREEYLQCVWNDETLVKMREYEVT